MEGSLTAPEAAVDSGSSQEAVPVGGRNGLLDEGLVTEAELEEKLTSLRNEVGVQLEELAWQIRLLAEQLIRMRT